MAIIIEQRSRATVDDPWGAWDNADVDTVTDGTFTNTDVLQFKTSSSITIDEVTTNVTEDGDKVIGDGVFDDLMETITTHLDKQHTLGHITGADYATVYLGSMQSALTESMKFVLQRRASEKNEAVLAAQEALYKRQKAGFDDNKHQKILDVQMNAWGITFQDTDITFTPDEISKDDFNTAFVAVRKDYYEA